MLENLTLNVNTIKDSLAEVVAAVVKKPEVRERQEEVTCEPE